MDREHSTKTDPHAQAVGLVFNGSVSSVDEADLTLP